MSEQKRISGSAQNRYRFAKGLARKAWLAEREVRLAEQRRSTRRLIAYAVMMVAVGVGFKVLALWVSHS